MNRMRAIVFALLLALLCSCGLKEEALTWQEQYDLGTRYLSEGNYEEAIIAFTAAIEIDPKQEAAYIGLADVYIAQGDTDKAAEILQQAIEAVGETEALATALAEVESESVPESRKEKNISAVKTVRAFYADGTLFNERQYTYDEQGQIIRIDHIDHLEGASTSRRVAAEVWKENADTGKWDAILVWETVENGVSTEETEEVILENTKPYVAGENASSGGSIIHKDLIGKPVPPDEMQWVPYCTVAYPEGRPQMMEIQYRAANDRPDEKGQAFFTYDEGENVTLIQTYDNTGTLCTYTEFEYTHITVVCQ